MILAAISLGAHEQPPDTGRNPHGKMR